MNTLTPEPVSNETRIKQIADELREMLKNDNDARRLISEQLGGVTYYKGTGNSAEKWQLAWTVSPKNIHGRQQ